MGFQKCPFFSMQILCASDEPFKMRNLKGFGSSFAPAFHIEESPQSDLAIGASQSDTVLILK